jgi:UDPglucose 6-dehydrogenase
MKISIIGCGYVGLVTGTCLAEIGHDVMCLDINKKKINSIKNGTIPFHEANLESLVLENIKKSTLSFTTSYKRTAASDVIFICVDTPSGRNGEPDLKNFNIVRDKLVDVLSKNTIIVTKSTVPIGTNKTLSSFFLKETDGKDFSIEVCSNPEFLQEGSAVNDFLCPNRIIIGSENQDVIKSIKKIYAPLDKKFKNFITMSMESAELTKYASNAFLATKISFMNEISRISDIAGADMNQIKEGMSFDPRIGNQFLNSGLGYGGSCFPKDLSALMAYQKKSNLKSSLVRGTIEVNRDQLNYFVKKIHRRYKQSLKLQEILIWGLSFKPHTDDMRESMGIKLVKKIASNVKNIHLYDPACSAANINAELPGINNFRILEDPYNFPKSVKCLVICSEWPQFLTINYKALQGFDIFDGRNILKRSEVEANNIAYFGLGA